VIHCTVFLNSRNRSRATRSPPRTSYPTKSQLPVPSVHQTSHSIIQSDPGRKGWLLKYEQASRSDIIRIVGWVCGDRAVPKIRLPGPDPPSGRPHHH
jgi:hypothetical protein